MPKGLANERDQVLELLIFQVDGFTHHRVERREHGLDRPQAVAQVAVDARAPGVIVPRRLGRIQMMPDGILQPKVSRSILDPAQATAPDVRCRARYASGVAYPGPAGFASTPEDRAVQTGSDPRCQRRDDRQRPGAIGGPSQWPRQWPRNCYSPAMRPFDRCQRRQSSSILPDSGKHFPHPGLAEAGA